MALTGLAHKRDAGQGLVWEPTGSNGSPTAVHNHVVPKSCLPVSRESMVTPNALSSCCTGSSNFEDAGWGSQTGGCTALVEEGKDLST